jgi:hypothetical protein
MCYTLHKTEEGLLKVRYYGTLREDDIWLIYKELSIIDFSKGIHRLIVDLQQADFNGTTIHTIEGVILKSWKFLHNTRIALVVSSPKMEEEIDTIQKKSEIPLNKDFKIFFNTVGAENWLLVNGIPPNHP